MEDGVELHYVDQGRGAPIVFVHGWMMSSDVWRIQVEHFSRTHRIVAPDLRGCGASATASAPFAMPRHADDLHRLITQLDLHGVALVGWSMGGGISMEYLERHGPERIAAIGLVDFPPRIEEDASVADKVCHSLHTKREPFIDSFLRRMFLAPPPLTAFERIRNEALRCPPDVACAMYRAMRPMRPDVSHAPLDLPAFLAFPEKGWFPKALDAWKERFPNHVAPAFPGSKHCPFLEEADAFNAHLDAFLGA
jgi:pimeloyl-ACP methyl ester carboxylesterase